MAVALAWLDDRADNGDVDGSTPAVVKLDDVRPWLMEQDKETLATLLMEAAARDESLREKLLRQAARQPSRG